ncbi:MAG TPA: hypothetical protein PLL10_10950, partial [Elusimicrobiales bacterium]|nr:hypothetical protein [Elusimicrobiales bacterium]
MKPFFSLIIAIFLAAAGAQARAAEGGVFAGALEGKQITELLQKRGLSAEQSLKIASTLSQVRDTGSFAPSDKYKLTLDKKGRFVSLVIESGGKSYAVANEDGSLTAAAPRQEGEEPALPKAASQPQEEKKPLWRETPDGGRIYTGTMGRKPLVTLLLEKGISNTDAS